MKYLIEAIMCANEDEIEKIMRAAIERKRELFPQWVILYKAELKKKWDGSQKTEECVPEENLLSALNGQKAKMVKKQMKIT